MPTFETIEKVNKCTQFSCKPSVGCGTCTLAHELAAAFFPPLGLDVQIQHAKSGQGTARSLTSAHRAYRKYLNLASFHSHSF